MRYRLKQGQVLDLPALPAPLRHAAEQAFRNCTTHPPHETPAIVRARAELRDWLEGEAGRRRATYAQIVHAFKTRRLGGRSG